MAGYPAKSRQMPDILQRLVRYRISCLQHGQIKEYLDGYPAFRSLISGSILGIKEVISWKITIVLIFSQYVEERWTRIKVTSLLRALIELFDSLHILRGNTALRLSQDKPLILQFPMLSIISQRGKGHNNIVTTSRRDWHRFCTNFCKLILRVIPALHLARLWTNLFYLIFFK